jgi:hypothetical protein
MDLLSLPANLALQVGPLIFMALPNASGAPTEDQRSAPPVALQLLEVVVHSLPPWQMMLLGLLPQDFLLHTAIHLSLKPALLPLLPSPLVWTRLAP